MEACSKQSQLQSRLISDETARPQTVKQVLLYALQHVRFSSSAHLAHPLCPQFGMMQYKISQEPSNPEMFQVSTQHPISPIFNAFPQARSFSERLGFNLV
eukprot:5530201-Amphidinium_carterae.1